MANLTKNYGLKKPLMNEVGDIDVVNENMDKIDSALLENLNAAKAYAEDAVGKVVVPVQSVNGKTGAVVLSADDVGADVAGSAAKAESNAKAYVNSKLNGLSFSVVNGILRVTY